MTEHEQRRREDAGRQFSDVLLRQEDAGRQFLTVLFRGEEAGRQLLDVMQDITKVHDFRELCVSAILMCDGTKEFQQVADWAHETLRLLDERG
jgi:hypothetical protein